MAVSEQTPYIEYTANGTTTSFALEFDCDNQDHLIVLVDDVEPVVGAWSLNGGAVIFGTAPEDGKKITIQRNTPFSRNTDFQSYNNSFRPQSVNGDFDRVWYKIQELGVKDWLLDLEIQKFRDDVNLTALENTLIQAQELRDSTAGLADEVLSNTSQSQTLLADTTAQANAAALSATSANSSKDLAKQYADNIDASLTAIAGGHKAYATLAAALANTSTFPQNSIVEITNDGANNGTYQWNGADLTKSAYDPLTQAKLYTDMYARSQAYENTRHLDSYDNEGRIVIRFIADASIENGFPQEAVGQTGYIDIVRNGFDGAVYQRLVLSSGFILLRRRASGVWSTWELPKLNLSLSTSTDIKSLALSLQRSAVYSMKSNEGTIANGYPYEGAQGTLEIFADAGWSAKTLRFTSVNRQTWICTYRDNVETGRWSDWVRTDYSDDGIFGLLDRSKTTVFDFSNVASTDATKLNANVKVAYSETNITQFHPASGFSAANAILKLCNGGTALFSQATSAASGAYRATANLLTGVNQTLAISFYHDDTSAIHSIFSQTSPGQAGRLQIAANCYYTGAALAYEKDSLCVFLGVASEGAGLNGSVKKAQLLKGWNTLILQIGDGSKSSKLLVNGKMVDVFTSTILNTESMLFPNLASPTKSLVGIGRLVAYKDVLSDGALNQLHQWLIKPYELPSQSLISAYELSRKPIKHTSITSVSLTSSLAAACMVSSDDGSYMSRDVLYAFNPDMQLQIYSTTKIMTFMVLMDMQPSLNEVLTRTEFDPAIGSGANLDMGDQIYLRDALYNLMLPSSNVSARMIARTFGHKLLIKDGVVGGTDTQAVARWVTQMNAKAADIGMTNTLYATPDGNGADKSTVVDMLKKGNYALKYPLLNKVWNTKAYTLSVFGVNPRNVAVTNSNTLLENDYTIGGKSGSADVTNLVSIHQLPDLQKLVTVVLHSANTVDRNADTTSMVNVALARY